MTDKDTQTTEYEIVTGAETFRITIPSSYKVTYGLLQPGTRGSNGLGGGGGNVLRIYESDKQQRAVFQNVVSFRDLGLPLKRKVVGMEEKAKAKDDGKGNAKTSRAVKVEESWEEVDG